MRSRGRAWLAPFSAAGLAVAGLAVAATVAVSSARADAPAGDVEATDAEASHDEAGVDTSEADAPHDEAVPDEATDAADAPDDEALDEGSADASGEASSEGHAETIAYRLERIDVRGNRTTTTNVVLRYVAVRAGELLDVDDERIEQTRYTLLGTGFFSDVRLSLERGSRRGQVVLLIEVVERSTFQIDNVILGVSEGLNGTAGADTPQIDPYGGISVSDSNLLGTGDAFSATLLVSGPQQGARLRFEDPAAFGSSLAFSGMGFFSHGREYYGDEDVLVTPLACDEGETCEAARSAVVHYLRGGGSIGTALSIAPDWRLGLAYQLEIVSVLSRPDAASELRGLEVVPIDFHVQDGVSAVSMLDVTLVLDERDQPALTRSGTFLYVRVDLANRLLASDYDFFRAEALARTWIPLPGWDHTLRLSAFGGAALGDTPFFYRFYASDLSDLIPSRVLELNLDHRSPLNVFDDAIAEHRIGQLAARVDVEYQMQLARWDDDVRSFWLYANAGAYFLGDLADFQRPIRGYSGAGLVPADLTFDVGFRLDTSVGVFQVGFSNLLGFVTLK